MTRHATRASRKQLLVKRVQKVSAVIPVLNEAATVESAVRRAWAAGADEVIVSDGGSTDGSASIARQQACQVVESSTGRAIQQNQGARAANGDILLFLHADNWLAAGTVDQIRTVCQDGQVHYGGFLQQIQAEGSLYRFIERGNAMRVRRLHIAYGDQGIFVRRSTFNAVGGFPTVSLMEDLRLMRSLRLHGRPALLPGPIYVSPRRWQRNGVIRQTLYNWSLLTAEKIGISPDRLARFYPPH
ncbi:MAG: TIGR04283 family arsenosugar biosynthesis glycosyltransferase [Pirellulales bacterium]